MEKLKGKRALVTGASQGIGASTALALLEAGCDIAIHSFQNPARPQELCALAKERGQRAICVRGDLTNEAEAKRIVAEAAEFLGGFDVLVNNSGSLVERRWLPEVDLDYWRRLLDVNLTTMMLVTREAMPHLAAEGSSIVNVASLAGRKGGHAGSLVYSMTKGAVLTWTRSLASELAAKNVRVNAVAPGFIEGTNFHATHTTRESAEATIRSIPLGRSGNPEDVARAIVFLASEYDGFITGATLDINGGVYAA